MNSWCRALGIEPPDLAVAGQHREAGPYAWLLLALLESGEPMTLPEVAERVEGAGLRDAKATLASLKRCKPATPPIYRDEDRYSLDVHNFEVPLWLFRLGLRKPKVARVEVVRPEPGPLPDEQVPLSAEALDELLRFGSLGSWSNTRLALAVLEGSGRAMQPEEVASLVAERSRWRRLATDVPHFARRGSPIQVGDDGRWSVAGDPGSQLRSMRLAARQALEVSRRNRKYRPDPVVAEAQARAQERREARRVETLASLRRVLLVAFPRKAPRAITLLDVGAHTLTTQIDDLDAVRDALRGYDLIGAEAVRGLLREIEFDPGDRRLAELGPGQQTVTVDGRGRTLRLDNRMLVQSSCNIARPFGEADKLAAYLERGQLTRLRRRLEADAKSLAALYRYGVLHGMVRLLWGFLDDLIPAHWGDPDDPGRLFRIEERALDADRPLEVVLGTAPGWEDPWARAVRAHVLSDGQAYRTVLVTEDGERIDRRDVQAARVAGSNS